MGRQRTWTDEQLINAVKSVKSMRACIKELGLVPTGGNYSSLDTHINRLKLDRSHWTGQGWLVGSHTATFKGSPIQDLLVKNSSTRSSHLKHRLIVEGILENKCEVCGLTDWLDKEIVLQLDHINGEHNDNRLENLRLLCPNCDSQQDTFRGRNKRLKREAEEDKLLKQLGLL